MFRHRLLTGDDVEVDESPQVEAFIRKVRDLVTTKSVTEDDLTTIIYSVDNPILDKEVLPGRGAVTPAVFAKPAYVVLTDLLDRKRIETGSLDVTLAANRYTMTVTDAAEKLGVHVSAVRQAIAAHKLSSWKRDGKHYLAPDEVANYQVGSRGPAPPTLVEIRSGTDPGPPKVSFQVKALGVARGNGAVQECRVARWNRVGVLAAKGEKARFFELEPAAGEEDAVEFEGFFVRGPFRIRRQENNAKEAGRTFRMFEPS